MFESLGEIAGAGPVKAGGRRSYETRKRTDEPVRRHSHLKGRCEGVFWRRTSRREAYQIVVAARRYEVATRQPGAQNGALGFVALEVLDLFANMVDFRTGRLDPSLDTLMKRLKRSRDAIVRALAALRTHGFLDWLRRYVPTGNEGRGPKVQQTSNAYRLSLPARAMRLMGRAMQPAPAPDDFSHAQEIHAAEIDAHRAAMSMEQRALFDVADEALAASLAELGRRIAARKERESSKLSESSSRFISMGK